MDERNPRDTRLANRADWQLPAGVSKGNWDYSQTESIALEYDEYFQDHALLAFDESKLDRWFTRPGVVVDFGCGTGRALENLLERGMTAIGIDLSQPMLNTATNQLSRFSEDFTAVRANLVDLSCIADETADYSICLFSTLGMIQGHDNRHRALGHMRRILKPGGLLVLHVHNFWFNLYDPGGPWWLIRSLFSSLRGKSRGDKTYDYRGIRNFYLHVFGSGEIRRLLRENGFRICEWIPLRPRCDRELAMPWLLQRLRASGWVVCCEKPR